MQPFEKIQDYSKSVCDQIRWQKAHPVISEEIENHLSDQRDAYITDGLDEMNATNNAIAQMGDPITIGTQLDRTHRPKPQWSMLLLTTAILFIGLFIRVFIINDGDKPWLLQNQLVSSVIGLLLMAGAYFSDFTLIGKYPKTTFFLVIILSVAVFIISPRINGQAFYAGFMPLLFPLGLSAIICATRNRGYWGILFCGLSYILLACIAYFVPTLSGLVLNTLSGLIMLCIAISKNWFKTNRIYGYLLVSVPAAVALFSGVVRLLSHGDMMTRLQAVINPSIDPTGTGYIGTVTRAILNSSKLFGRGDMPAEYALSGFVPNVHADYLLTYLIFNIGWIAFIIIMSVLLFFIIKGFALCCRQKSGLGLFVSVSVMLTFTVQVIGYVIANLGFQFSAPISLPLISYGNVATIINLTLIGLMLSVFRTGDIVRDTKPTITRRHNLITWGDGKLIISYGKR